MSTAVRHWMMFVLTLIFVILYGTALMGWPLALADEQVFKRLEPIIFIFIGYYFGRLPSQQNESMLIQEISRQTQKANAAQHAKEQAQQTREMLEEKMKNAKTALGAVAGGTPTREKGRYPGGVNECINEQALRHSVAAALNILNS